MRPKDQGILSCDMEGKKKKFLANNRILDKEKVVEP